MAASKLNTPLLAISLLVAACGQTGEEKQPKEETARQQAATARQAQEEQERTDFAKPFNADTAWAKDLAGKPLTSLLLQDTLLRADGRPIIVPISLIDIARQGKRFRVVGYVTGLWHLMGYNQHLTIETSCQLTGENIKLPPPPTGAPYLRPAEMLLAIKVKDIQQVHGFMKTHTEDSSSATLQTEFKATGECLGVKSLSGKR